MYKARELWHHFQGKETKCKKQRANRRNGADLSTWVTFCSHQKKCQFPRKANCRVREGRRGANAEGTSGAGPSLEPHAAERVLFTSEWLSKVSLRTKTILHSTGS